MLEGQSASLINEDLQTRQSRWGSLIADLEDEWDADSDNEDSGIITAPPATGISGGAMRPNGLGGMTKNGSNGNMSVSIVGSNREVVTPPAVVSSPQSQFPPRHRHHSAVEPFSFPSWWTAGGAGIGGGVDHRAPGTNLREVSRGSSMPPDAHNGGAPTLRGWIRDRRDDPGDAEEEENDERVALRRREYLEASVRILGSLVDRIVGGYNNSAHDKKGEEAYAHPSFITLDNIVVRGDSSSLSAEFVESGDSIFCHDDKTEACGRKYEAMDALGRLAYEVFTMGEGPEVFRRRGGAEEDAAARDPSRALGLEDKNDDDAMMTAEDEGEEEDEIIAVLRKAARTTTSERSPHASHGDDARAGVIPAMLAASVPFPLCRLVSDLLFDEDNEACFGRSEHSFSAFEDVASDLRQMADDPDAFLHGTGPDRWRLAFGRKLYGRDGDTKAFLDAADRVATTRDDPIFEGLNHLTGRRKEVVMVKGRSGGGKSRLVRTGGALLEERGWRFLRCKFDRVVHPEPLSVVACAFDQYIGSLVTCPIPGMNNNSGTSLSPPPFSSDSECNCSESQAIQESLQSFCQEDLAILAKHIPSLQLLVKNLPTLPKINVINEAIIHTLFRNLLQLLSSKDTPILFFLDDLQWADPLSLALLTAMVKGEIELCSSNATSGMNKLNAGRGAEEDINVMFVGSYRDNEVDGDHPLSKVLSKFQSDRSINVTDISLSGFTVDTLNKMLSDTLLMPVRRVRSLSEIVIQKTDGQPLHVIEFVQALTADNLLAHSFERGWEWDADSIDICPITDSVAELFAFKLRRLPPNILLGLQIVSVFGSQVDQRVLDFVADYDGDDSVSILEAIRVGNSEGLVERASSLVSFSHDMIQKATIDSIDEGAIIALLRKLAASLIKNASTVNDLDSVLYVIVDLINRIGSDATPSPKQRQLFADLNSRAGTKAIKVPDFAGAAKYAENGISFLSDDRWETQYDLSLCLHEVAVLSHFSSLAGNRDQLMKRINSVFEHAKDFSDQFQTRCIWIKLLSMKDLSKAIEESLHALEQLGEPLDLKGVDSSTCRDEMARRKEQFAGKRKEKFLSSNCLSDRNKVRAMKIFSSLIVYYHMQKSYLVSYISCQMIKMTMSCGHCEHSVFGAASFASALVTVLDDIDEGTAWGRTALSLMNMYERNSLIPSIHGCLYGTVFVWKEPIQATLEPLAMGIRLSFATGNVEFAMINTIFYIARSFNCGKNIRVLIVEVEALARQHGNHFGNDTSSNTPVYSPLLQFYLTPLYNILQTLEGEKEMLRTPDEEEISFPLDKVRFVNNSDILDVTLKSKQFAAVHTVLSYETVKSFIMRDMDTAMKLTDLYFEHFLTKDLRLMYTSIYNIFYEALINFHHMRLSGEEKCRIRGESAFTQMREWSAHSDWNFKNKLLLVEAELYYTRKDYARAAICYEASIEAAREHKFMNEEAMASELAGIFCFEIGLLSKAKSHYLHSVECFKKWGALAVCSRLESSIQSKFGEDSMQIGPNDDTGPASFAFPSKESCSKKRQSPD